MKKICHIVDSLEVGGLQKTVCDIVLGLPEFDHQVWCLRYKGELASRLEGRGVTVRSFGYDGPIRPGPLLALARNLKKGRIDIVHAHGHYPSEWARTASVFAGVKTRIVHEQSIYHNLAYKERIKLWGLSGITSAFIAVSEAVKRSIIKDIGVTPSRIYVIYNSSADMLRPPQLKSEMRRSFGITEGLIVGTVGRLESHKGFDVLINSIRILRDRGNKVSCLIAGDGPDRARLEKISRDIGLEGHIRFLGMRQDVADVLAALDIFVQPSLTREGLPLVLAEASSAAIPSVATDIGGNPEIVIDGKSGFIIRPNDAVSLAGSVGRLLENAEERLRMGGFAREIWMERFTNSQMCEAVKRLYRRYLQEE